MTLPPVIEITPQVEAVTRDTFIDRLAAVARAVEDPTRYRSAGVDRDRSTDR